MFAPQSLAKTMSLAQHADKLTAVTPLSFIAAAFEEQIAFLSLNTSIEFAAMYVAA